LAGSTSPTIRAAAATSCCSIFTRDTSLARRLADLHYNLLVRAREGESAGILNYPIFVGLNVGGEGVQLHCYTVNVRHEDDESLLNFLESDTFQSGLKWHYYPSFGEIRPTTEGGRKLAYNYVVITVSRIEARE